MQARWFLTFCLAAGALLAADSVWAADKESAFQSGLKAGDKLFSFKCHGIAGPHKGKTLCFIWINGGRTGAMLFARDVSGPLGMLLKQIEDTIAKNKTADMRSFAVFPTADRKGMEPKLLQLARQAKLSEAYALVIPEDPATLKPYKIHPDAELTVVLFKKWKVVGNFAFKTGQFKETDVATVVAELVTFIPTKEELEQDAKEQREAEQKRAEAKRKADEAKKKADEAKKKADEAKQAQKK